MSVFTKPMNYCGVYMLEKEKDASSFKATKNEVYVISHFVLCNVCFQWIHRKQMSQSEHRIKQKVHLKLNNSQLFFLHEKLHAILVFLSRIYFGKPSRNFQVLTLTFFSEPEGRVLSQAHNASFFSQCFDVEYIFSFIDSNLVKKVHSFEWTAYFSSGD